MAPGPAWRSAGGPRVDIQRVPPRLRAIAGLDAQRWGAWALRPGGAGVPVAVAGC